MYSKWSLPVLVTMDSINARAVFALLIIECCSSSFKDLLVTVAKISSVRLYHELEDEQPTKLQLVHSCGRYTTVQVLSSKPICFIRLIGLNEHCIVH